MATKDYPRLSQPVYFSLNKSEAHLLDAHRFIKYRLTPEITQTNESFFCNIPRDGIPCPKEETTDKNRSFSNQMKKTPIIHKMPAPPSKPPLSFEMLG